MLNIRDVVVLLLAFGSSATACAPQDGQSLAQAESATPILPKPEAPDQEAWLSDEREPVGSDGEQGFAAARGRAPGSRNGLHRWGSTYGGRVQSPSWWGPWSVLRSNIPRDAPRSIENIMVQAARNSVDRWNAMLAPLPSNPRKNTKHPDVDFGPRWVVSVHLTAVGHNSKSIINGRPSTNGVNSLLSMARVAAGDYDRYWIDAFTAIANLRYGGYDDFPRRGIIGMAHETNGDWYGAYAGVDPNLVGNAQLQNASASEFGPTVANLLKQVAVDGNRGPLFRYSYMRMVDIARAIDPTFVFLWTWTNAAANPDGSAAANSALNFTSLPLNNGKYIDLFGGDIYCRGSNRPRYVGGPVDQFSSWDLSDFDNIVGIFKNVAVRYGVPLAFGEVNAMYNEPGTSGSPMSALDDQAAIWLRRFFGFVNDNRVGYWGLWNSQADKIVGTSFFPDPSLYPHTTAVMTRYFPAPADGGWPL